MSKASDIFFVISIVGYVLALICLIIAITLFFRLKIPYVIKDLNGTLAQMEISDLRKRTMNKQNIHIDIFDPENKTFSKLSGKLNNQNIINQQESLSYNQGIGDMGTTVLQSNKIINKDFIIVKDIVYIHTDEKI